MQEKERIERVVSYFVRMCNTRDPFKIADQIGILYQIGRSKYEGCYMYLKKHRYIFLSDKIDDTEKQVVMAHELGHALLDPKQNCYFIRNKTFFLTSKPEIRANTFAAYLLISDDLLTEFNEFTREQFCNSTGYPDELINLRLK